MRLLLQLLLLRAATSAGDAQAAAQPLLPPRCGASTYAMRLISSDFKAVSAYSAGAHYAIEVYSKAGKVRGAEAPLFCNAYIGAVLENGDVIADDDATVSRLGSFSADGGDAGLRLVGRGSAGELLFFCKHAVNAAVRSVVGAWTAPPAAGSGPIRFWALVDGAQCADYIAVTIPEATVAV